MQKKKKKKTFHFKQCPFSAKSAYYYFIILVFTVKPFQVIVLFLFSLKTSKTFGVLIFSGSMERKYGE